MSIGMAFALLASSMHYRIILNVSAVYTTTVTGIICYHFNLFYIWYNFEGGKFCVGWGYDRNDALTIFIVHVYMCASYFKTVKHGHCCMVVWYIELECNGFTSISLCDYNLWPSVINVLSKRLFNVRLSIQYCLHKLNNNLENQ